MVWSELPDLVRVLAALAFIVALMGGFAFILKKLGLADVPSTTPTKNRRLKVVESLALDRTRRLVILQRDEKQHLVILSANGETIVESDFDPVEDNDKNN